MIGARRRAMGPDLQHGNNKAGPISWPRFNASPFGVS
jgi:hypothetical protein